MSGETDRVIGVLRSGHDELISVLDRLSPEGVTQPSGAAEWTVARVLAHLGSDAESMLTALDGASAGRQEAESNAMVRARWDEMTPAEQAANFRQTDQKLLARLEHLNARNGESLRIEVGFAPQPMDLATLVGVRLNEVALHRWDVRVAFDPRARIAADALPQLVDSVAASIGFLGQPDRLPGPVRLAVHTTAPDRAFGLLLDGTAELSDEPQHPDAALPLSAEFWIRLTTGRHAPIHTPASVGLSGTALTLDDLRMVFPGF